MATVALGAEGTVRSPLRREEPPAGNATRALIVDDNPEIRRGLREALSVWGYEPEEAEDAAQAWDIASRSRPDVIVMDGIALDVIGRIKAEDANVFVVVFSGWAHLEAATRAAGADAFVVKPDFDGLERAVSRRG